MIRAIEEWMITRWNWPYATAFAAFFLLALFPLLVIPFEPVAMAIALVFIQLPAYMLHQLEEHAGDRFREFTNAHIGHGVEVLSRRATFVINSLGVWGVDLLALYLAVFVSPALGLMAIYLPLVNGVGHIAQAAVMRKYNPGLWTAIFVFLPLGLGSLFYVTRVTGAGWKMQAIGLGIAVLVHAMIIVHVKRRLAAAR